jgi:hypothetical protein
MGTPASTDRPQTLIEDRGRARDRQLAEARTGGGRDGGGIGMCLVVGRWKGFWVVVVFGGGWLGGHSEGRGSVAGWAKGKREGHAKNRANLRCGVTAGVRLDKRSTGEFSR